MTNYRGLATSLKNILRDTYVLRRLLYNMATNNFAELQMCNLNLGISQIQVSNFLQPPGAPEGPCVSILNPDLVTLHIPLAARP